MPLTDCLPMFILGLVTWAAGLIFMWIARRKLREARDTLVSVIKLLNAYERMG